MKADWDKLGDKYANSDSVMIVDVDCTADGQGTCQKYGVKGYPTVKYFMAGKKGGKAYQGGRDFNSLATFTKQTLEKVAKPCNPSTGENCKDIEKRFIAANKDKTKQELDSLLAEKKQATKDLKQEKREYEKDYRAKQREFKKAQKKIDMATNILKSLAKSSEDKEEL